MHGRGGQTTSDGCNDVVGVHHGPVGWNQVCVAQEAEVFEGFQYEPACEIARPAAAVASHRHSGLSLGGAAFFECHTALASAKRAHPYEACSTAVASTFLLELSKDDDDVQVRQAHSQTQHPICR